MTVAELIEVLRTYPENTKIVLMDADTYWEIPVIHHEMSTAPDGVERVILSGEYCEMGISLMY